MPKSERVYNHLEFKAKNSEIRFSGSGFGLKNIPERTDNYYIQKRKELEAIKRRLKKKNKPLSTILKISGETGKEFLYQSLDISKGQLRLLSIKENWTEENEKYTIANVQFKNKKAFEQFSNKLLTKRKGKTKQSKLCLTIQKIEELKSFEDLVTDYSLPENFDSTKYYWVEIWLPNDEGLFSEFISFLRNNFKGIIFNPRQLILGDRNVALINANKNILNTISNTLSYIAEIRFPKKVTHFFDLEKNEKLKISDNLLSRISLKEDTNTTSVILDTGVNRGHRFLQDLLPSDRNLTLNPDWGSHDESYAGKHGTQMAGICAYGDFCPLFNSNDVVNIEHTLTSVKILASEDIGEQDILKPASELIGDAVELVEKEISFNKNYVLAVTTDSTGKGMPSLYSTLLDTITHKNKSLFLVSAGNCNPFADENHPTSGSFSKADYVKYQETTCVDNPAQSWNALSVGAYTEKADCSNLRTGDIIPFSQEGDVSPHSRFSMVNFKNDNFPIKPEILFEGGNRIVEENNSVSGDYHLDLITTNHDFQTSGAFTNFNATSAATALAGRFASILMENYPQYWPETIKGLMVHSADWTQAMIENRLQNTNLLRNSKIDLVNFLRQCGFGVPNLERAKKSAQNSLTLISQTEFNLFGDEKKHNCVSFDLPWPKEILEDLSDKKVTLKVTLSYFITPKAGARGNKNKFKYQSHGFRFALKRKDETEEEFYKRVNKALRAKGDSLEESSPINWVLGPKTRSKIAGTIIKDIWEGQGIELASMDKLIVYPVGGWWKEDSKIKPEEAKARFSLIIDIETEEENVNLYNEIKSILELPIMLPL